MVPVRRHFVPTLRDTLLKLALFFAPQGPNLHLLRLKGAVTQEESVATICAPGFVAHHKYP